MAPRSPSHRRGQQVGHGTLDVVADAEGRLVLLTRARWRHIVNSHPELSAHRADVLRAVRRPTVSVEGRVTHEVWFYLASAGPSRWLKVVVHFQGAQGWIVTAFARRSAP